MVTRALRRDRGDNLMNAERSVRKSSEVWQLACVRLRQPGFKSLFCWEALLSDMGPVILPQPNISHRIVVRIKGKKEELCVPAPLRKGGVKMW